MLDDGTYDVLIVDARGEDNDVIALDLTLLAGDRKGEVVTVRASGLDGDELDLLGLPGTLTVENGVPRVDVER